MDTVCACRVLWLRQRWTIRCQCSQQTWWAPWHNRWTTFPWAPQERWVAEFVSLDFISERQHFLFFPATSAEWILHRWGPRLLCPCMNKPHSACTVLGHMYLYWQGWRVYFAAFKFDLQKVLTMPCPRYVCFRPCNWIHWSIVFLSQMFMIWAHSSPRLFPRGEPTLIIANTRGFLFAFNVYSNKM